MCFDALEVTPELVAESQAAVAPIFFATAGFPALNLLLVSSETWCA